MSTRLAETNFDLFRSKIAQLRAIHAELWMFPGLDCVDENFRPGSFRLGSLLSISIVGLGKLLLLSHVSRRS